MSVLLLLVVVWGAYYYGCGRDKEIAWWMATVMAVVLVLIELSSK